MTNCYQDSKRKIIPAVLLYAFYQDQILMIEKKTLGIWNGLGGKLEQFETTQSACQREFKEESGCETTEEQWQWLAQIYFPNFVEPKNEDWWVTVFTCELSEDQYSFIQEIKNPPEGKLCFFEKEKIHQLPLWDGDRHFIPFLINKIPFQGTIFYKNGKYHSHHLHRIIQNINT